MLKYIQLQLELYLQVFSELYLQCGAHKIGKLIEITRFSRVFGMIIRLDVFIIQLIMEGPHFTYSICGGFLRWWHPKIIHFRLRCSFVNYCIQLLGYHHFKKSPCMIFLKAIYNIYIYISIHACSDHPTL